MGAWHAALAGGRAVELRATSRADGDLAVDGPVSTLAARRAAVVDRPWVWLRQVHGSEVVVVGDGDDPAALAGRQADGAVTARTDVALVVHGADCGILGLWSPEGVVGVAHAGWRGVEAGVIGAVADAMRQLGASELTAVAGPCIGPECYEFGTEELDRLTRVLGPGVRATTAWGTPALDLPGAIAGALQRAGVRQAAPPQPCTACAAAEHWSFRARGERERQALVAWITEEGHR